MSKCFSWSDYHLLGPIALSLDDYTFRAYGLGTFYAKILGDLKRVIEERCPVRWRLSGLWGEGKSTFLYNLCHRVNNLLYFNDEFENLCLSSRCHMLSIYVPKPSRKGLLLKQIMAEGLPIPWDPVKRNKFEMQTLRELLLMKCFRKLAYLLFRTAFHHSKYRRSILETKKRFPSKLKSALRADKLQTNELIRMIDESDRDSVYSELQYTLASWFRDQTRFAAFTYFANLLYPLETQEFLQSFNSLRNSYNLQQWQFDDFWILCNLAGVHLLLIIDELEDWKTVIKSNLDKQFISMVNEESLSIILAFRTLFPKGVKKGESFDIYLKLFNHLQEFRIPDLDVAQLVQLTEGVLQTSRQTKEASIFPLTRDFVFSLATRTKRRGKFNVRLYIRCLSEVLEKSLEIPRDKVKISDELLSATWARDIIADKLVAEAKKQRGIDDDRALLRSAAADEIASYMLVKGTYDRQSFDKLKVSMAKKWRCRVPSDIEVIASVEDRYYRRRLQHIIEALK